MQEGLTPQTIQDRLSIIANSIFELTKDVAVWEIDQIYHVVYFPNSWARFLVFPLNTEFTFLDDKYLVMWPTSVTPIPTCRTDGLSLESSLKKAGLCPDQERGLIFNMVLSDPEGSWEHEARATRSSYVIDHIGGGVLIPLSRWLARPALMKTWWNHSHLKELVLVASDAAKEEISD